MRKVYPLQKPKIGHLGRELGIGGLFSVTLEEGRKKRAFQSKILYIILATLILLTIVGFTKRALDKRGE